MDDIINIIIEIMLQYLYNSIILLINIITYTYIITWESIYDCGVWIFHNILFNVEYKDEIIFFLAIGPELTLFSIVCNHLRVLIKYKKELTNTNYLKSLSRWFIVHLILGPGGLLFVQSQLDWDNIICLEYWNYGFMVNMETVILKVIILVLLIIVILIWQDELDNQVTSGNFYELILLLSLSVIGMFILVSANDLFLILLGLELQTMPYFIMCSLKRYSNISIEAGLKYFTNSCICSGILIIGITFIYGSMGTLNLTDINNFLYVQPVDYTYFLFLFGMYCILVGLYFKLGIFPFHTWIPEIYVGSPNIVTLFLLVLPKLTIIWIFFKIFILAFFQLFLYISIISIILGLISHVIGGIYALYQSNIKKLIAYSTIANMGLILLVFTTGSPDSIYFAVFFYLTYILSTSALFFMFISIARINQSSIQSITDCISVLQTSKIAKIIFVISLLSLAGIPPFSPIFFGKVAIFYHLIEEGFYLLAGFLIIFSVLTSIYYIRIIRMIWFDENLKKNKIEMRKDISKIRTHLIIIFIIFIILFIYLLIPLILYLHLFLNLFC